MIIEVVKRGKMTRVETKLQPGDFARWNPEDKTMGFFRPGKNGAQQTLYNSFDGDDKFRFDQNCQIGPHELVKMVADSCNLGFEKLSSTLFIEFVFKARTTINVHTT